ncbi:MAG: XRE family transcriptional regulator [bacterium]|nr:XRE family transcriptional regulator [Candidatus Limimorpha equi]
MGARIRAELKRQGRTVSWLAKQLCMERTGLYYTFRQSSINTELLLRISCCLEHNFFKDVSDAYEAFGL